MRALNSDDEFTGAVVAGGVRGGVEYRGFTIREYGARGVSTGDVKSSSCGQTHQKKKHQYLQREKQQFQFGLRK